MGTLLWAAALLAGIAVANVVALLAARVGVARAYGVQGVSFVPFRERGAPVGGSARVVMALAGLAACYALAALLFAAGYRAVGRIETEEELGTVARPIEGTPVEAAGLRAGDRLVAIDGSAVERWSELATAIRRGEGRTIVIEVLRDGDSVTLEVAVPTVGRIGLEAIRTPRPVSLGESLAFGASRPVIATTSWIRGFVDSLGATPDLPPGGVVAILNGESTSDPFTPFARALNGVAALDSLFGLPASLLLGLVFAFTTRRPA